MSQPEAMRQRTKRFAIRIVRLFRALPRRGDAQVMGHQLLRCGTSVAANYRAVCRARSKREFIAKIAVVLEEADESVFWLELLEDTEVFPVGKVEPLLDEARQLTVIFGASLETAKRGKRQSPNGAMTQSLNRG